MRLAISIVALCLPAYTSAARHRAGKPQIERPVPSLRVRPKQSQRASAGVQRIAEEQDGDFSEADETRQDPLIEEIEPEAPLAPEQLPEVDPMPASSITNCEECLGGQHNWLSDGTTTGGKCFQVCPRLQEGWSCWPGTAFDETKCAELEEEAVDPMPEQLPEVDDEDTPTQLPEVDPMPEQLPEMEVGEPTTPDLPVPADLLTCESCLGPDAMGQIFAWFPLQGETGLCLSGCGVLDNTPCFTGAVYSDENCDGIAAAMEQLEAATKEPTAMGEEPMTTDVPTVMQDGDATGDEPTAAPVEAVTLPEVEVRTKR